MPIPIIDLFAGPGGLNEGFSSVLDGKGHRVFKTALSVEMDPLAHSTLELRALYRILRENDDLVDYYRYLRGEIVRPELFTRSKGAAIEAQSEALNATLGTDQDTDIENRIRKALSRAGEKEFVLIGGPPCQAYSLAGRSRRAKEDRDEFEADPKQRLYKEYLRIVTKFRPAVFLMENVSGLLSAKLGNKNTFSLILEDLAAAGYKLHPLNKSETSSEAEPINSRLYVVRAEEHGVPQCRARVFILGIRSDVKVKPSILEAKKGLGLSVADVIDNLPKIRSKVSGGKDEPEAWVREIRKLGDYALNTVPDNIAKEVRLQIASIDDRLPLGQRFTEANSAPKKLKEWYAYSEIKGVVNHNSRGHMASDLRRYLFWAAYAKVLHRSPTLSCVPYFLRPAHENVSNDSNDIPFADRFRVQIEGKPSTTITSHISKDGHYYIHPDPTQCRSLSVREAARLQTFPDTYFFEGPVTKQYHQVGNAVPPYLAHQIGEIVAKIVS